MRGSPDPALRQRRYGFQPRLRRAAAIARSSAFRRLCSLFGWKRPASRRNYKRWAVWHALVFVGMLLRGDVGSASACSRGREHATRPQAGGIRIATGFPQRGDFLEEQPALPRPESGNPGGRAGPRWSGGGKPYICSVCAKFVPHPPRHVGTRQLGLAYAQELPGCGFLWLTEKGQGAKCSQASPDGGEAVDRSDRNELSGKA